MNPQPSEGAVKWFHAAQENSDHAGEQGDQALHGPFSNCPPVDTVAEARAGRPMRRTNAQLSEVTSDRPTRLCSAGIEAPYSNSSRAPAMNTIASALQAYGAPGTLQTAAQPLINAAHNIASQFPATSTPALAAPYPLAQSPVPVPMPVSAYASVPYQTTSSYPVHPRPIVTPAVPGILPGSAPAVPGGVFLYNDPNAKQTSACCTFPWVILAFLIFFVVAALIAAIGGAIWLKRQGIQVQPWGPSSKSVTSLDPASTFTRGLGSGSVSSLASNVQGLSQAASEFVPRSALF